MSFDTSTRNRLASFVGKCRAILCGDFKTPGGEMARLLAHYGIQDAGECFVVDSLTHLDEPGRETAHTLRELLAHKQANAPSAKVWGKFDPAVYDLIQEQGFTVLNRICALRMAEERKILQFPCISKGLQSDGFELYEYHTGKANADISKEDRFQHFIFSLFDELSLDLGSLFDRFNPQGLIFPEPSVLNDLLEEINHPDLANIWAEDETIGWIYQYWNSKEERTAMRAASAAPRNSRELAVRNQFFTPRYVVEFLTDNTLGRIWYEMTQGQTRLAEQCRYLVRRPTEIFLGEGEEAPDPPEGDTQEALSQEELLKQPVHIPHRPVKDPREIRLLDPACGSMHFGLYAFDLFEAIYEEAWDLMTGEATDQIQHSTFNTQHSHAPLTELYDSKEAFMRDVPKLIIENNVHGVDIDPRAVQIAGLSLWLRAQKTWKDTPAAERPRVRRSNIVCAEPMPGSDAMLEDFLQTLDPPLLGELVKTVFDKMQLAGEAGTLLKIEEEIRTAIDDAKAKWEKLGAAERDLFTTEELNQTLLPGTQQQLTGIEKALATDHRPLATDFFDTAEERIYAALRDYAESAEAGDYQRRLFAEDAAHGFAFIDLCRKRYDAVVMNPPFGTVSKESKKTIERNYPLTGNDLFSAFIERGVIVAAEKGLVGAITSRTGFFVPTFQDWREQLLLRQAQPTVLADLGYGVLDSAMVETAAYCLQKSGSQDSCFFRLIFSDNKSEDLVDAVSSIDNGSRSSLIYVRSPASFQSVPGSPFSYWVEDNIRRLFKTIPLLESDTRAVRSGLTTGDDFRFLRLSWETEAEDILNPNQALHRSGAKWYPFAKGGEFSPFFSDLHLLVDWSNEGAIIRAGAESNTIPGARPQNIEFFFRPGLTWTGYTTTRMSVRCLPSNCVFAHVAPSFFDKKENLLSALSLLNSDLFYFLMSLSLGLADAGRKLYGVGNAQRLPFPAISKENKIRLNDLGSRCFRASASVETTDETNHIFITPESIQELCESLSSSFLSRCEYLKGLEQEKTDCSDTISSIALYSYGLADSDRNVIVQHLSESNNADSTSARISSKISNKIADSALSYALGTALGRWDIRYATGERQPPELPDPFDPLPVCPPGMLQNADGLPAAPSDVPDDYPLPITWPGILVDDEGHPEDIVARVRDALAVIWGERSAAIEQEAYEILGVRALRDYFAEKKSGGKFFKDHLKRYSKSRRQAPIYWPLSTESGTYTLWIYYHRLTENTLYSAVTQFIEPKQEDAAKTYANLSAKKDRTKAEDKELESVQLLVAELATFRESLLEIAKFWKPNLNDGVQITAAPLWKHFRLKTWQKKLKETWQKLEAGDYDWAHLAHSTWPERVIPKCLTDRSLAIAHGHDESLWEEVKNDKGKLVWQPKKDAEEIAQKLIKNHQ